MRKTLRDAVQEALDVDPSEQIKLYEELAVIRMACGQIIALWDGASSKFEEETDPKKKEILQTAMLQAGSVVRDAMNDVRIMAESIHKMKVSGKAYVSIHDLGQWVNRITLTLHDVCGEENRAIAEKFEEILRKNLKVNQVETPGVDSTPDEVAEMDRSIPKIEENLT